MKSLSILTIIFALILTAYAGPTTNQEEYKGDALLTKKQQEEYTQRLEQGTQYFNSGKYDLAETEFKTILTFAPKKALAYFNLGLTKYRQENYQEAIKYFDKVIKMRSYYVGAAFYYKSISQLNLEQNDEAIKTAKRYTNARFFYKPAQSLIESIKTGSDEYYENAKLAYTDENYELCLLEMDESVLTDTRKGRELVTKCTLGLRAEAVEEKPEVEVVKGHYYNLYLDTHLSQTDNIYQETKNKLKKLTYFTEIGGEFILRNYIDTGVGFFYNQFNALDLARFKDETYNIHIPLYFRLNKNKFSGEIFYNLNKFDTADAYSDTGLGLNYSYNEDKYLLGFYGSTLSRTSLNQNFNYKAGTYNVARVMGSRYINEFTLSANAGYEQVISGDQPWGSTILPYANKTVSYGLLLSYDLNKASKISLRTNLALKDYSHKLSSNNIYRDDKTTSFILAYQHAFTNNIKAYIQQSMIKNISNYESPAELIDRNYTENITTLGLSLLSY